MRKQSPHFLVDLALLIPDLVKAQEIVKVQTNGQIGNSSELRKLDSDVSNNFLSQVNFGHQFDVVNTTGNGCDQDDELEDFEPI